jgi:hypothetical protein
MAGQTTAHRLVEVIVDFYQAREHAIDEARMLEAICTVLLDCRNRQPIGAPRMLPAAELLSRALDRMSPGDCRSLGAPLRAASHLFHWRQNPNYNADNMGAAFMAGYGYVEFAGPKDALFHAPDIRVGLLVLGPGLHYPPHAHPAEEIYHPLTDGGLWRRGEEAWRTVPAGHAIHHPPMMPHETRSSDVTLLALYCWRGETGTEACLAH